MYYRTKYPRTPRPIHLPPVLTFRRDFLIFIFHFFVFILRCISNQEIMRLNVFANLFGQFRYYDYFCSVRDGLTFRDPLSFQHIIVDGMLFYRGY